MARKRRYTLGKSTWAQRHRAALAGGTRSALMSWSALQKLAMQGGHSNAFQFEAAAQSGREADAIIHEITKEVLGDKA